LTRLFLIRHARSVWNAHGRIQGQSDPPLDDQGREQARRLAERLREEKEPIVALYTSPLQRAQETADVIGCALDLPPLPDDRLKERDHGDVVGLTWKEVAERYPDVARRWAEAQEELALPGEEDNQAFRARVVAVFDDVIARHTGGPVAVVTHGGTLGAYLNHLIGLPSRFSPFRFGNASLTVVEMNRARPHIVLLNDTCHLGGKL